VSLIVLAAQLQALHTMIGSIEKRLIAQFHELQGVMTTLMRNG
jgi:hypothetical protein